MIEILSFKLEIPNLFLSGVLTALGNPSFLCILGSRMLFNLKEAGERGQNEGTSYNATLRIVSNMEFVQAGPANSVGDCFTCYIFNDGKLGYPRTRAERGRAWRRTG